ncbi:ABC transporter permease [uncultured Chitinophaga sp.]|jgi:ABC-type transport system, involved in lipoprotein release, permease component|uniref:ABC transporter permease n=1 Tax=uncultured Chitinophaga sp. TaxID=339340 RepID=UPI0026072C8F|nr:ABC transporter permease [uncultured Chitinophaga sp.]
MIKNYFRIAWRNLVRNKAFSTINILGLALGLACSLIIMLWVQDERSVDGFHVHGKQLYQVYGRWLYDGKVEANYTTQALLADELKRVIPEVEHASSLEHIWGKTFQAGTTIGKMNGGSAGEDFFKMFSYPLLQGTPETALNAPGGIAISRRMAEFFFGSSAKAIGKPIRFENKQDLTVTAVFENLPANSSHQFDFLRTWVDYVKENRWVYNWSNTSPATMVQLRANANPAKVQSVIKDFVYRYQRKDPAVTNELALQPFLETYLHSNFKNGHIEGGRIEYVRLFSIVAFIILLIACINFMNLATARSAKRAKEVGVRKVIGAYRSSLILQFTGEALMITAFAVVLAVIMAAALLPAFNQLTGKQLSLPLTQPLFWALLAGLLLLTGLIAGSYPAWFLSSLQPVRVLKGSLKFSWSASFLRKGLVVFQFMLSIVLITGMIVIYRQIDYTQTANLGYNRENLIYIPVEGELVNKYALFKQEALNMRGVLSISRMKESPTQINHHIGDAEWEGKDPAQAVFFADAVVGYDFVKTMGLQLKEGRDFSPAYGTDSVNYLINETALAKTGYTDPIGRTMLWGNRRGQIIGVLKDFHINSMYKEIEPLLIRLSEQESWGNILVRTRAGKTREVLAGLEKLFKTLNPKFTFTYQFSDEEYARLYHSEQVVSKLSNIFAALAIFISCLGLFGLAAFSAEQRTREIGVRKVMGATVSNIFTLLSASFLKPVAIAMFLAFPLAWYATDRWLQQFAYKISLEWWMFAVAGLLAIIIAMLTVSYQSVKAALMNPVKSLRVE